eukprot:g1355.t1
METFSSLDIPVGKDLGLEPPPASERGSEETALLTSFFETQFSTFCASLSFDAQLRKELLHEILIESTFTWAEPGQVFFYQGDISHSWYFIIDGSVSVYVFDSRMIFKEEEEEKKKEKKKKEEDEQNNASSRKTQAGRKKDKAKASETIHHRRSLESVAGKHYSGVKVISHNLERLPPYAKLPFGEAFTAPRRTVLGKHVTTLHRGNSFGQVGLIKRRERSATVVSDGCLVMIVGKASYNRCVRPTHVDATALDRKFRLLRLSCLFATWPAKHLQAVAYNTEFRVWRPGQKIFQEGEKAAHMIMLLRGTVHITQLGRHRITTGTKAKRKLIHQERIQHRDIIEICRPMDVLGTQELLAGSSIYMHTARIAMDSGQCEGIIISVDVLSSLLRKHSRGILREPMVHMVRYASRRAAWYEKWTSYCSTHAGVASHLDL